jgi:hypothetical protein
MSTSKKTTEQLGRSLPRYPGMRITLQSENPLAMVAAVRQGLRLAGAPADEISDFSDQALSTGVDRDLVRQVVDEWVGEVGLGADWTESAPSPG